MAGYAQPLLDDIRAAVDIVDLVGRFVNLRKAGQNWKGLCPFHAEKTPSFTVNPKKGIFHCFGCGVGGDVFGFLMRQDKLNFPEAVRALARQAGVALPETREERADGGVREPLLRAMDLASRFYAEALWKPGPGGEPARRYLDARGITQESARRFGLGVAPESWDALLGFMRSEKVDEATLVTAGLAVAREGKPGVYDRFRHRLIFPIRDQQGRVVALGGRAFGDEQPKYLNSPETPLYTKGNLLYAADLARDTIQARNRALLVEGYVDCLIAHQHGFTETVAALGTAFTGAQLGLLRRYCDEVVTFFDADAAGRKAAERAEELLEPQGGGFAWAVNRAGAFETSGALRVKVALLPAGHDPDTFLRAEGAEAFAERIAQARSLLAYALDRTIEESGGGASPRGKQNAFARIALMLAKVGDAQEATALSREAAQKLGVDATQLWIEAQRLSTALRRPPKPVGKATMTPASSAVERDLVALLLLAAEARAALLPMLEDDDLTHAGLKAILVALRQRPDAPAETLMPDLDDAARSLLASILVEDKALDERGALIEQFRRRLDFQQRRRRMRTLGRSIAETQQQTGPETSQQDELHALHQDGARVYAYGGGVAQSLEPGSRDPKETQTNE